MSNIRTAVREILKSHLGLTQEISEGISDQTEIVTDLGADSLDVIEVCMAIEDDFRISIPDTSPDKARTFGDLVRIIESQTGKFC